MLGMWRTWEGKRREPSTPVPPGEAPCSDPQGGIARGQRLGAAQVGQHCPARASCRAGAGHRVALAVRGAFVCAGSWPQQHKVDREDPRPLPHASPQTRVGGCAHSAHRLLGALPGGLGGSFWEQPAWHIEERGGKRRKGEAAFLKGWEFSWAQKLPPEFTEKEKAETLGSPGRPQLRAPQEKQRAPPRSPPAQREVLARAAKLGSGLKRSPSKWT